MCVSLSLRCIYYACLVVFLSPRSSSHHHHHHHMQHTHQQTHTHIPHTQQRPSIMSTAEGDTTPAPVVEEIVRGAGAYEDPELLHKLADTMRQKMKIRNGVLQETRVDYFKGG